MKDLYGKLFDACSVYDTFANEAHFVAMKGSKYDSNPCKVMIVGRATNSWEHLDATSKEAFMAAAEAQFGNESRWDWIEVINGAQYCSDQNNIANLKERYCVSQKAFWSYSKEIWTRLTQNNDTGKLWQENIVWSNLYKYSPAAGYNPDDQCAKIQQNACIEILKHELDVFQPDYVLLITGYDWFESFAPIFEDVQDKGERNICRGKNKNEIFVEGTATYNKTKVVIACRPELRDKVKYVDAVVNAFN